MPQRPVSYLPLDVTHRYLTTEVLPHSQHDEYDEDQRVLDEEKYAKRKTIHHTIELTRQCST